ncbi:hypothetical protein J3458_014427 [Metarhizium acridum]|uniref:uncharacterized protein n=1 Tax=Metarhizium acridum TaxID=92637 RepID=UPI001C6B2F81|nr:hypothetical protein J3458_014427 [Metarhizium acridum]
MENYSVQRESQRILEEQLLKNEDPKPFIPTPCKITESVSALAALVAAAGSAVGADRYGIGYQNAKVDTDLATLFIESIILPTMNGKPAMENDCVLAELKKGDLYEMTKPIHQQATNVYQTKDGKWYHLHGSMNASATMGMVGVEEQDVTREEAIKIFGDKVAQYDAAYLEKTANEELRQAGVTCLSPEEFFASEHGKIMADEPLWTMTPVPAPQSTWPLQKSDKFKPLEGIRVIDFSRVIAAPVISKVLAVLGAEVIKVSSKNLPDVIVTWIDLSAGKKDANIDLKSEEGKNAFRRLVAGADVLIDGYRPSVLDKLGFNSESLRKINQKLVYVRENCYGFKGPLAYRSGWQQISDCLVGISWLQGKFMGLNEPVVPLLPNSDYQTGLVGAIAVRQTLFQRTKIDSTYDVDVSLTQFNIWYYRLGQYTADQCKALLARNEGFHVRHYNEMYSLIQKTHAAICKVRPELLKNPDYFSVMTGREWGVDDNISILAPPFKLETSVLEYAVPSGARGRSIPEWEA